MYLYIWLKTDGDVEKKLASLKRQMLLGEEIKAETDRKSAKKYIQLYEDVMDPTTDIPNIPEELIERVTLRESIYTGFRTNGVYRHSSAELMVKTHLHTYGEASNEFQEISVSAPSIEALKAIYTLVRQGKLLPAENWEQDVSIASDAAPANKTEEKETTE